MTAETEPGETSAPQVAAPALPEGWLPAVACLSHESPGFLADPYLPRGALTLLSGNPGEGKSTLASEIAAAVSAGRGLPWADGPKSPGLVLWLGEEPSRVVAGRLDRTEADLSRCLIIEQPDPAALPGQLAEHEPALLIIDPIDLLVPSHTRRVRELLRPLVQVAAKTGVAILGIRHLRKSGGSRAIHMGLGSVQLTAVARSELFFGKDPASPDPQDAARVLAHLKSNLAALGSAQEFAWDAGRLVWLGQSELTAADLVARVRRQRGRTAVELAGAFLQDELEGGSRPAADLYQAAASRGIAARTLRRARAELGVEVRRSRRPGSGTYAGVVWSLPTNVSVSLASGRQPTPSIIDPSVQGPSEAGDGPSAAPTKPPATTGQSQQPTPAVEEEDPSLVRFRLVIATLDDDPPDAVPPATDDDLPDSSAERFRRWGALNLDDDPPASTPVA